MEATYTSSQQVGAYGYQYNPNNKPRNKNLISVKNQWYREKVSGRGSWNHWSKTPDKINTLISRSSLDAVCNSN